MRDEVQAHGGAAPTDEQRFAEHIPEWVTGQLPDAHAQWMADKAAQHPHWAEDAQWLRDFRSEVHQQVRSEPTEAAWGLLQGRLDANAAAPSPQAERALWQRRRQSAQGVEPQNTSAAHRARQQRWWRRPIWTNALASVALAVVLGHTAWQFWGASPEDMTAAPQGAAWRALELDDLSAAAPAYWQARVQLPVAVTASQWHSAVLALGADVQARPLADGRWQLQLPQTHTPAQWRDQLLAQPGLASVQWQDDVPVGTAVP